MFYLLSVYPVEDGGILAAITEQLNWLKLIFLVKYRGKNTKAVTV